MTTDPLENWQVPHLEALAPDALIELFERLPAPEPGELQGEYAGFDYYGQTEESFAEALGRVQGGNGRSWLGKAFPGTEGGGAFGYNRLLGQDGSVARLDCFGLSFGPSPRDGRPSLLLKYSDFDNGAGSIGLLDEVRRVNERLFLCTAIADEGRAEKVSFFFLGGPPNPFVGADDPAAELVAAGPR